MYVKIYVSNLLRLWGSDQAWHQLIHVMLFSDILDVRIIIGYSITVTNLFRVCVWGGGGAETMTHCISQCYEE